MPVQILGAETAGAAPTPLATIATTITTSAAAAAAELEEAAAATRREMDGRQEGETTPPDAAATATTVVPNELGLLPEELVEVPTFMHTRNCAPALIAEARQLLRARYAEAPQNFFDKDVELILADDWTMSRFLLRCRLEPARAIDLVQAAAGFRKEFKMGQTQLADFPAEIHQVGGIFQYAPDRVGNQTLWMRAKYHRRSSEMSQIMKQFILCVMEQCDKASQGRGVAVVFDLTDCGLKNADPALLYWLLSSFRNFCPKGLSYILVYNLPWVLSATCSLALGWLSSSNRKRLRFIEGDQIQRFIAPENLPDFVPGGCCKLDYRAVPTGAVPARPSTSQGDDQDELVPISEELAEKLRVMHAKFTSEN